MPHRQSLDATRCCYYNLTYEVSHIDSYQLTNAFGDTLEDLYISLLSDEGNADDIDENVVLNMFDCTFCLCRLFVYARC